MKIIDTIVSREGRNSVWANVVFVGDNGESVSIRLPCPVPTGGFAGRMHIIRNAAALLRDLVECKAIDGAGEPVWSAPGGRFGVPHDAPSAEVHWGNGSVSSEE